MEINLHKRIVSKAHLYGNGCGTRLGKIELFFPGFEKSETISMPNHKAQQYSIVTGSGLLAGVVVRHGHDIDALALVFLRPLASVDGYMDYGRESFQRHLGSVLTTTVETRFNSLTKSCILRAHGRLTL